MDKTVGIIGLGIMGGAIARNLIERGWRVIGFDVNPERNAELAQAKVSDRRRRGSGDARCARHHDQPPYPRSRRESGAGDRRIRTIPANRH